MLRGGPGGTPRGLKQSSPRKSATGGRGSVESEPVRGAATTGSWTPGAGALGPQDWAARGERAPVPNPPWEAGERPGSACAIEVEKLKRPPPPPRCRGRPRP